MISDAGVWPRSAALLTGLLAVAACGQSGGGFELGGLRYDAGLVTQWALPRALREISGLTIDPAGRLFTHADETAMVSQIDHGTGRIVRRFAVGDPVLTDDYEGIAWADGHIYLVTSNGTLIEAEVGDDGGTVDYVRYDSKLGRRCEIEGLLHDATRRLLLMPCKTAREPALENTIALLAWSIETSSAAPAADLVIPWQNEHQALHPSGLARSPGNGHYVLVAARERALIELSPAGELIQVLILPKSPAHPQMEGVTFTTTGELIIADEGGGKRGRLSVYSPEL
jgi:uncharacterized protein YjiK